MATASSAPSRTYREHLGAVPNPMSLEGQPPIKRDGVAHCAELVKQKAGAPRTQPDNWKKGMALTATVVEALAPGTPIASGWDVRGFYPNNSSGQHAGIYGGPVKDGNNVVIGFIILEQYRGLDAIQARKVYFDPAAHKKTDNYLNRGSAYATIQW